MGLLIDKNGLPIGYELFSGNTFDSKTMVKVLNNLKRKFNIDKVVILDKSMYNNILSKEDSQDGLYCYNYFGYYNDITYDEVVESDNGNSEIKKRRITLKEMMTCTYSDKRAKKDRYDRYRALDKANSIILNNQKSSLTSTRTFKKFIQKQTSEDNNCKDFTMRMDWFKIKNQQQYDGYQIKQKSQIFTI